KGTAFTVILPVGKEYLKEDDFSGGDRSAEDAGKFDLEMTVDKAIGGGPKKKQTSIGYEDSKPLILIVEDNADLRDYIRSFLEDSFQIMEAGDGEAGLKRAIETVPDLIVSDVMMPRMDGYELCKKLKTDERTSHIPFILLTARASMESKIEGLETGADDFITKPFDQLELQIRINNLIRQRRKLQLWILNEFKKSSIDHILNIDPPDLTSMDQQFYKRLTKAVLDNISNPDFKVKNLVSLMNMSHSQLHRKMVAITGHTANQFIRSLRLTKASELLANKTATVTEIAFETGFNNLSYFTKCFRHQFGVLPSEYAR
ncbi:MAG: response regulator, partial [Desulfobacterales bacterium]|nr:response regulator [Desulfobacterales bacterium]